MPRLVIDFDGKASQAGKQKQTILLRSTKVDTHHHNHRHNHHNRHWHLLRAFLNAVIHESFEHRSAELEWMSRADVVYVDTHSCEAKAPLLQVDHCTAVSDLLYKARSLGSCSSDHVHEIVSKTLASSDDPDARVRVAFSKLQNGTAPFLTRYELKEDGSIVFCGVHDFGVMLQDGETG
jgi:hypothetical protein